jgi:hypothetical protein
MSQSITAAPNLPKTGGLGAALGYGIHDLASDPIDPNGDWVRSGKFTVYGDPCISGGLTSGDPCIDNPDVATDRRFVSKDGCVFVISEGVECSTFGTSGSEQQILDQFGSAALARLQTSRWSLIAAELWDGQTAESTGCGDWFTNPTTEVITVNPAPLVSGVAALVSKLQTSTIAGNTIIHVPTTILFRLAAANLITTQGNRTFLPGGVQVVADAGYSGAGPGGVPPTAETQWIYATGPITYRASDVRIYTTELGPVNPQTNDVKVWAQQQVGLAWLCGAYAAEIESCD